MSVKNLIYKSQKILCALFLAALLFNILAPIASAAMYDKEKVVSPYSAVYNVENEMFIFEKDADEPISATSCAKLMTAVLALEHYSGDTSARITITSEALKNVDKAVAGFRIGDSVSVKDLLYASLIANCTYSASVLAYAVSGSQSEFGKRMNAKAAELGMENTAFASATCFGADVRYYHTTVRDSILLAAYAMKNPVISEIVNTVKYTFESFTSALNQTIYTKNGYISTFVYGNTYYWQEKQGEPKPSGISFTYSQESGYSLISSINFRSLTYICMCAGAFEDENKKIPAYSDVKKLLLWASDEYTTLKVLDKSRIFGEVSVRLSEESNYVVIVPGESLYAFLPRDTDVGKEIIYVYEITEKELTAPVEKGQPVGKVILYRDGKEIASCALVTKAQVSRSDSLAFRDAFFSPQLFIWISISLSAACLFGIIRFLVFLSMSKTRASNRGKNSSK